MKIESLIIAACTMTIVMSAPLTLLAKQTFRDAGGNVRWTMQGEGVRATYRNAEGKVCGIAQKESNGKVTYRNAEGKVCGTAQKDQSGKITYRNAEGKTVGTAQKDQSGKVTYRNKDGKVNGTAQMNGITTTYRNAQGKVVYTVQGEKTISDIGFAAFKLFE